MFPAMLGILDKYFYVFDLGNSAPQNKDILLDPTIFLFEALVDG